MTMTFLHCFFHFAEVEEKAEATKKAAPKKK